MPISTHGAAHDDRPKASEHDTESDADVQKGAVEDDQPPTPSQHSGNTTMRGQLGHRSNIVEGRSPQDDPQDGPQDLQNDTDFPEPGSSPEHSGQHR